MWDSNAPLQLLKSMPKKLGKEHLEKIQMVIDADKYKNSLISGFDLCGMYAPFCRDCKKTSIYPCALEEGAEPVEIAPPEEEIRKEEHVEKRKIRIAVARKKLF